MYLTSYKIYYIIPCSADEGCNGGHGNCWGVQDGPRSGLKPVILNEIGLKINNQKENKQGLSPRLQTFEPCS